MVGALRTRFHVYVRIWNRDAQPRPGAWSCRCVSFAAGRRRCSRSRSNETASRNASFVVPVLHVASKRYLICRVPLGTSTRTVEMPAIADVGQRDVRRRSNRRSGGGEEADHQLAGVDRSFSRRLETTAHDRDEVLRIQLRRCECRRQVHGLLSRSSRNRSGRKVIAAIERPAAGGACAAAEGPAGGAAFGRGIGQAGLAWWI